MRIFSAPEQDPVLLDTTIGLNEIYSTLQEFLNSSRSSLSIPARTDGTPAPYDEFLPGLRVTKGGRRITVAIEPHTRELRITGPEGLLRSYIGGFKGLGNAQHCHLELAFQPMDRVFENGSLYPYVEADDYYEAEGYAHNA